MALRPGIAPSPSVTPSRSGTPGNARVKTSDEAPNGEEQGLKSQIREARKQTGAGFEQWLDSSERRELKAPLGASSEVLTLALPGVALREGVTLGGRAIPG